MSDKDLLKEIERLRAALESIANEFTHCPISEWDDGINCMAKRAIAALEDE